MVLPRFLAEEEDVLFVMISDRQMEGTLPVLGRELSRKVMNRGSIWESLLYREALIFQCILDFRTRMGSKVLFS